ncbi:hypothetical protein GCM10009550_40610 [Actinocorallia libanotica]|uniref:Secreted protein n=2 Tax=Actinocorallia libanotica TaxID=46162 RepID=A0ABN1RE58_9ACTN
MQRIASAAVIAVGLLAAPGTAQAAEEWTQVAPAFTWPDRHFADVEGTGDGGAWAVGFQRTKYVSVPTGISPDASQIVLLDVPPKPVLQRFDGTKWKNVATHGLDGDGALQDVDAVSASDVWISGYRHTNGREGTTYLAHWDGTKWNTVDPPAPFERARRRQLSAEADALWLMEDGKVSRRKDGAWTTYELGDVWDLDTYPSGGAWAQGGRWLRHFDGTAWKSIAPPPGGFGPVFHATGPDTGWTAAGSGLARWDGSSWTTTPYPAGYKGGGTSSNADPSGPWVQVIPEEPTYEDKEMNLHWDGSSWQRFPSAPLPTAGTAQGDLWTVMDAPLGSSDYYLHRWNGTAWVRDHPGSQAFRNIRLTALPGGLLATGQDKNGNVRAFTTSD